MDKMHKYSIIWGIILFAIVALLTTFGFVYKNKTKVYKDLESKIIKAEKIYVDEKFLYPDKGDTLKTSADELMENGYLDNLEISGKPCKGYAIVEMDNTVYEYKGYVSCDKYKTSGYEK